MKLTLGEIAKLVGGELIGDPCIIITGISGIKEAKPGDITFLANLKYAPLLETTKASAVITSRDVPSISQPSIRTQDPSLAFAKVAEMISPRNAGHPQGVHPQAVISSEAKLAKDVCVGANAIIEDGAKIGQGTVIYGGCYIGKDVTIGKNSLVYPHVSILARVEIGDRVIIHSSTVVGSDGFGFTDVEGVQKKIPQIGIVVVGDDVEIGANVAIDRARFDRTVIGKGTKIDNLVQIAHNVIVGENCIIVSQAGVSGSTTIGKGAILAGQAGIVGHITIGEGAIVAAQAGVTKNVAPGVTVSGYPARPHDTAKRVNACLQNLPEAFRKIKDLERQIEELKQKDKDNG